MTASTFETMFNQLATPALQRVFGVLVVLSRGVVETAEFTARRSNIASQSDSGGFTAAIDLELRDYIVPKDAIVFDGQTDKPERGDLIIEGNDVFEVLAPIGTSAVEEHTPYEWLVHTKQRGGGC